MSYTRPLGPREGSPIGVFAFPAFETTLRLPPAVRAGLPAAGAGVLVLAGLATGGAPSTITRVPAERTEAYLAGLAGRLGLGY